MLWFVVSSSSPFLYVSLTWLVAVDWSCFCCDVDFQFRQLLVLAGWLFVELSSLQKYKYINWTCTSKDPHRRQRNVLECFWIFIPCFKDLSRILQGCFQEASMILQCFFIEGLFKNTPRMIYGCFQETSDLLHQQRSPKYTIKNYNKSQLFSVSFSNHDSSLYSFNSQNI